MDKRELLNRWVQELQRTPLPEEKMVQEPPEAINSIVEYLRNEGWVRLILCHGPTYSRSVLRALRSSRQFEEEHQIPALKSGHVAYFRQGGRNVPLIVSREIPNGLLACVGNEIPQNLELWRFP